MCQDYYAHSLENQSTDKWQSLDEHLSNVSYVAGKFARSFGGEEWCRIAGRYHDFGKGTKAWQAYLRRVNEIVDGFAEYYTGHPAHALAGAKKLYDGSKEAGKLLAYCVSGHHGGLTNWDGSQNSSLETKLQKELPEVVFSHSAPSFPADLPFQSEPNRMGFQLQFFVRMLFSCLVDADYLDTEAFLDGDRAAWRSAYLPIKDLCEQFWVNFNAMRKEADSLLNVNVQREQVLADCLRAADKEPGIFSLTVPTGGGKTLASLAFALNHAKKHGKTRIIYVIPFTSIIEQNAKVFREMLGEDAILEHHCNYLPDKVDWKTKLAIENWDAPVVVTTNVQFFNSFYANKTSKCRKLHNVANSIVIFDEVQAIPVEKLRPCLEVIKELTQSYGVTAMLCTATQPAIELSKQFQAGLKINQEIIKDVPKLFAALKRTEEVFVGKFSEQDVAAKLLEHEQVLCIVNTRQQALDIFELLPESEANIHLSALMYPAHRSEKLAEIRSRLLLENKPPCRVISTQLIEAGVDIDFPCVFRVVAGIDSIAQAAGRCNRNGHSVIPRKVYVFDFLEDSNCSFFRQAAQSAAKLFDKYKGKLTSPECVKEYFADFFWKNEQRMDEGGIVDHFCRTAQSGNIQFRDIAKFQMIQSAAIPVIIAVKEEAQKLVNVLCVAEHKGGILRKLQQFTVQIYPHQFAEIKNWLESPIPDVWVLRSAELYSDATGLKCREPEGGAFFG